MSKREPGEQADLTQAEMSKLEFAGDEQVDKVEAPTTEIDLGTEKKFFKIGEVAEILGVAPHVLRYWESEFKGLRPQKSRSQQRVYRRTDVETLLRIKHLLYERKFTIAGARQELAADSAGVERAVVPSVRASPNPSYRLQKSLKRVQGALDALAAVVREAPRSPELAADPSVYMREQGYLPQQNQSDDPVDPSTLSAAQDQEANTTSPPSGSLGQHLIDRPPRRPRPR